MSDFIEGILVNNYSLLESLEHSGFSEVNDMEFLNAGLSLKDMEMFLYGEDDSFGGKWVSNGSLYTKVYGSRYSEGMKTLDMIKQGTKAYYSYMIGYGPDGYDVERQGYIAYQDIGYKISQCLIRETERIVAVNLKDCSLIGAVFSFIYSECKDKHPEMAYERYKERWMQDSDGRVVVVSMGRKAYPLGIEYGRDGTWWGRDGVKKTIEDVPGINMDTIKYYQKAQKELLAKGI